MKIRTCLTVAALLAVAGVHVDLASAQSWRTITSSRQLSGDEEVEVNIGYGAGRLQVEPGADDRLYNFELRYDEDSAEPEIEWDRGDRRLELGIQSIEGDHNIRKGEHEGFANISLNPTVPMDLELEFGAGEAEIELGGMALSNVSISTGASRTRVNFSRPNRRVVEELSIRAGAADLDIRGLGNARAESIDFEGGVGSTELGFEGLRSSAEVSVKMGVGSVVLRIPRSVGVRVDRDSFLSGFDAPGMERRGEAYFNSNWSSATTRLTIDVSAVLGSIDIEWID